MNQIISYEGISCNQNIVGGTIFMQEMITKSVDVLGDAIMATKDADGIIWAGVSYFCKALGMNKGQKDRQTTNVQKDETLKRGCRKFAAGVFDPGSEAVGMRIDFIPMWLAKINITKTMLTEHPDLADKLLDYQLKAKDILAEAFLPKQEPPTSVAGQIQLLAQGNVELNKRVDDIQADLQSLKMDLPILPIEADRITNAVKAKGVSVMGGKESNAYRNRNLRQRLYNNLYANLKYNFGIKTYKSIKRSQCDKAIEIIQKYEQPFFLMEMINNENAQQRFYDSKQK